MLSGFRSLARCRRPGGRPHRRGCVVGSAFGALASLDAALVASVTEFMWRLTEAWCGCLLLGCGPPIGSYGTAFRIRWARGVQMRISERGPSGNRPLSPCLGVARGPPSPSISHGAAPIIGREAPPPKRPPHWPPPVYRPRPNSDPGMSQQPHSAANSANQSRNALTTARGMGTIVANGGRRFTQDFFRCVAI